MKGIDMLEIISNVDPKHIKAADAVNKVKKISLLRKVSAIAACLAFLISAGVGAYAIGFGTESGTTKLPAFLDEFTYSEDPDQNIYYRPITDSKGMKEMPKYKNFTGDIMDIYFWNYGEQVVIVKDVAFVDEKGRLLYKVSALGVTTEEIQKNYDICLKKLADIGVKVADVGLATDGYFCYAYMAEGVASALYYPGIMTKALVIDNYMYSLDEDVWYGKAYLAKKYGISYNYGFYDPIPTP